MAKFKVGDKVMVRSDLNENDRYYNENKETWYDCVGEMLDLRGKIVTIKEVGATGKYRICEEYHSWTDEMFAEPRREFVVIRRSGAETIAELRHDREVIRSAKATCAPSDTFDFVNKGAPLAFDRLMGRKSAIEVNTPAPEPPKFYTGKVKLAKSCGCYECEHIVGEEFVISNGYVISDRGAWGQPFSSFSDFVAKRHNKNWVEVKSDA